MGSILHLLLLAILWLQNVSAEWTVNILDSNNEGTFETICLTDNYSGCVNFINPGKAWFKEPFENTAWGGIVEFFEGKGCKGGLVYAQKWSTIGFRSLQAFYATGKSVYITSPPSSRKRGLDGMQVPRGNLTLDGLTPPQSNVTLNEFRQMIPIAVIEARRDKQPNPFDVVLPHDHIVSILPNGNFADWQFLNVNNGADANTPDLPTDFVTISSWTNSIATRWEAGHLTGDLTSPHIASWQASLLGHHTRADITTRVMRNAMFRALQFGSESGSTWISFQIADYVGVPIASFTIWMEN